MPAGNTRSVTKHRARTETYLHFRDPGHTSPSPRIADWFTASIHASGFYRFSTTRGDRCLIRSHP